MLCKSKFSWNLVTKKLWKLFLKEFWILDRASSFGLFISDEDNKIYNIDNRFPIIFLNDVHPTHFERLLQVQIIQKL